MSWLLPSQDALVTSVAITDAAIYAATWGHGLWKITGYRAAPLAKFFAPRVIGGPLDTVPALLDADEKPVNLADVWGQARSTTGVYPVVMANQRGIKMTTELDGKVPIGKLNLARGRYVVHLTYWGCPPFAPARTEVSFLFDVK